MTIKIGGNTREEAATATMSAIKRTTESNELRLQTLELAMANLTNICIGLNKEIRSLRSIMLESNRIRGKEEKAVIEMKHPYYSTSNSSSLCSDSKDDLGTKMVKRQTTRKPWKKDPKFSPMIKVQGTKPQTINVKANPKTAAKTSQKGSTGSMKAGFVKNMAPAKFKPPMSTIRVKASAKTSAITREDFKKPENKDFKKPENKASAKSVPVNVKGGGGGRSPGSGGKVISVKLPPHMADAPTIRSLIYGSKTGSVVKSGRSPVM